MPQGTLHSIIDQLPALERQELEELSEAVQKCLSPQDQANKRDAFHQASLASGLVKKIKPPRLGVQAERRLIEVQGKPVSESIIEERR